jgi:hypothetical protein
LGKTAAEVIAPRDLIVDQRIEWLLTAQMADRKVGLSAHDTEECRGSAQGAGYSVDPIDLAGDLDDDKYVCHKSNDLAGILYISPSTLPLRCSQPYHQT